MEPHGFSRESHLCFNLALDLMLICRQRESTVQVARVLWYIVYYGNSFLRATMYVVQQEIATILVYLYRFIIEL
jgi:hypothetical protein